MDQNEFEAALNSFLLEVSTPGQYTGREWNSVVKPSQEVACRVALCFPDSYSVGMSHHGLRVLYEILNNLSGIAAERAFTPLPDMEGQLRQRSLPLSTLETCTPLSECDLVGFSIQYELCASNLLTMLELGGIPLLAKDRGAGVPLVIAGGTGAYNPEPFADFIDLFLIGEGEEALPELIACWRSLERNNMTREELLRALVSSCSGWYAPALYQSDETGIVPLFVDIPKKITRRIVMDFDQAPHPRKPVVPVVETTHERVTLEIMRGCPNGCRFCLAGMASRPRRERSVESLLEIAKDYYAATGYDEIGLLSLSTSDYSDFSRLITELDREFAPKGVSLSLPSLRVDTALRGIPQQVKSVRKGGFTIAPEAATERLRKVINKQVTEDNLLEGAEAAFRAGWRTIKLYFMIGLPTETEEDVRAIASLANRVARLKSKGKGAAATLSVANFVPKPWTPFQWIAMDTPQSLLEKQGWIAAGVDRKRVSYKTHDIQTSLLEGMIARGDRGVGKIMLAAWRQGARLCAWSEYFQPAAWQEAFASCGTTPEEYACRKLALDSVLPWEQIDLGLQKDFLRREYERALEGVFTDKCDPATCPGCGVEGCGVPKGHKKS
ncbi:MAG: TIGR03960 family B12-binding radical SAM protein [Planctomycetes bacterium]|nr:TIGR03960 family B12-binding radical SAM protein [Planctomycetota bacterium]